MRLKTLSDAVKLQQRFAEKLRADTDDEPSNDPESAAFVAKRRQELLDQLVARLESSRGARDETVRRLDAEIAQQETAIAALRRDLTADRSVRDTKTKASGAAEPAAGAASTPKSQAGAPEVEIAVPPPSSPAKTRGAGRGRPKKR